MAAGPIRRRPVPWSRWSGPIGAFGWNNSLAVQPTFLANQLEFRMRRAQRLVHHEQFLVRRRQLVVGHLQRVGANRAVGGRA